MKMTTRITHLVRCNTPKKRQCQSLVVTRQHWASFLPMKTKRQPNVPSLLNLTSFTRNGCGCTCISGLDYVIVVRVRHVNELGFVSTGILREVSTLHSHQERVERGDGSCAFLQEQTATQNSVLVSTVFSGTKASWNALVECPSTHFPTWTGEGQTCLSVPIKSVPIKFMDWLCARNYSRTLPEFCWVVFFLHHPIWNLHVQMHHVSFFSTTRSRWAASASMIAPTQMHTSWLLCN